MILVSLLPAVAYLLSWGYAVSTDAFDESTIMSKYVDWIIKNDVDEGPLAIPLAIAPAMAVVFIPFVCLLHMGLTVYALLS